MQIIKLTL